MAAIDPLTAGAVFLATAGTDAVYVMFTSAVVHRKRVPAATWSSIWYVLSSYAVISYTDNWVYVVFAAIGSWVGAYLTITFLHRPPGGPPVGAAPEEMTRKTAPHAPLSSSANAEDPVCPNGLRFDCPHSYNAHDQHKEKQKWIWV